jgi:excisionase family DNA binding protein
MESIIKQGYYTKEAAKTYTGLSVRTLDYASERGELRRFKVGKRVLFAKEDLDCYIRTQQAGIDIEAIVNEAVAGVLGR